MRLIFMFIQCIQYFRFFVTRVTASDILPHCLANNIIFPVVPLTMKIK